MAVRQAKSAFGTDTGTEATHGTLPNNPSSYSGAIAAGDLNQNINRQVDDASTFLIRFLIQCDGGSSAANAAPQFEFNKNSAGWTSITTSSTNIKAVTPTAFANAAATTLRMGGSGGTDATNQGCTTDGLAGGAQMDIPADGQMETICAVQLVPATLTAGDTLDLRISGAGITVYDFVPRITITAGAVHFSGTPDPASVAATGLAPAPSAAAAVEPTPASAAVTGLAPTWAASIAVTPDVAALAITGFAPTVNVGLTQRLTPNAVLAGGANLRDTLANSPPQRFADIDEETGSDDTEWWEAVDPNADIDIRLGFPPLDPPGNLVGTQRLRIRIRGTSLPSRDWRVDLWESGSEKAPTASGEVTSIDGEVIELQFQPEDLTDITGAGVEIRIRGTAA